MVRGFWLRILFLLAALVVMPARAEDPPPPMPARVIAVGDLHGDYDAWQDIARAAGLIDPKGKWIGGTTVLVQTGDIADRGADSRRIIRDLMRLQREAARVGGRVVALVGNHEAMNMTGDLRYVSPGEYAAFADVNSVRWRDTAFEVNKASIVAAYRANSPLKSEKSIRDAWKADTPLGKMEHQAAWSAGGEIGKWVIANPAVLRLGDTIFVHAGLNADFARRPIASINAAVAAALKARDTSETAIINDQSGPLWYRGLAATDKSGDGQGSAAAGATLDAALASLGASHMVIGHTPSMTGIALRHDGRLAMIDTGIARVYGGVVSYLEIVGGRFVPHVVTRSAPTTGGKP
jgi:hypothetical protein